MAPRRAVVQAARIAFVVACVVALIVGFRGHGDEIADALASVSFGGVVIAVLATLVGHAATAAVWMRVTDAFGMRIPVPQSASIYFVSQLGKYIPGSVWSIGAQAHLASAFHAKPRVTAGAGLVTLGYFVGSGALISTAIAAAGFVDAPWPRGLSALVAAAAAVCLTPPVVKRAARLAAGAAPALTWRTTGAIAALCVALWSAWCLGVVAPFGDYQHFATVLGTFGICYAVGVLVILAPAGIGPREALLIAMLAPAMSVPHAAAVALVSRLVHAVTDVCAAVATWMWARSTRSDQHSQLANGTGPES